MKIFFARFRHSRLLLSFLFVFVDPVERCYRENFGSPWHATAVGVQTIRKRKTRANFCRCEVGANPNLGSPRVLGYNRACSSISLHFWSMGILSEAIKEYMRKGDARDRSSLVDLRSTR
jgi:hypothetical protein